MMKKLILMVGVAVVSALLGEEALLPLDVPCGKLTGFVREEKAQRFVDFKRAADKKAQRLVDAEGAAATEYDKPAETAPEELIVEREPETGMFYAIFTFEVAEGRTLSKYDYVLHPDPGTTQDCLEIGRAEGDFYDFRFRAVEGPGVYKLIFHCPKQAYDVKLGPANPVKLPFPPIGDFVINPRPAPPPAPEPVAPAAAPEGAAPAATTEGAAPAAAPAAPAAPAAAAPAAAAPAAAAPAAAPAPAAAAPAAPAAK